MFKEENPFLHPVCHRFPLGCRARQRAYLRLLHHDHGSLLLRTCADAEHVEARLRSVQHQCVRALEGFRIHGCHHMSLQIQQVDTRIGVRKARRLNFAETLRLTSNSLAVKSSLNMLPVLSKRTFAKIR